MYEKHRTVSMNINFVLFIILEKYVVYNDMKLCIGVGIIWSNVVLREQHCVE